MTKLLDCVLPRYQSLNMIQNAKQNGSATYMSSATKINHHLSINLTEKTFDFTLSKEKHSKGEKNMYSISNWRITLI